MNLAALLETPAPPARPPQRSGVGLIATPSDIPTRVPATPPVNAPANPCLGCGLEREFVDVDAPAGQALAFGYCAGCSGHKGRSKREKRRLADAVVRDADAGRGTIAQLAGELDGHVAAQTVFRRARVVGVGVNPPNWTDYRGGPHRWFVAAGRLLLAYLEQPRLWSEIDAWAAEQGWPPEDARNLALWLDHKEDAVLVREIGPRLPPLPDDVPDDRPGHLRWWLCAAPPEADDTADQTPAWARSLPAATLAGAGHVRRRRGA
jgi:hypothetical protein